MAFDLILYIELEDRKAGHSIGQRIKEIWIWKEVGFRSKQSARLCAGSMLMTSVCSGQVRRVLRRFRRKAPLADAAHSP